MPTIDPVTGLLVSEACDTCEPTPACAVSATCADTIVLQPYPVAGPPGAPGTGATASRYRHDQPIASASWNVAHNLNADVQIDIFSIGGVRMWAEVVKISPNNSTVLFDEPTAGYAVVI